MRVPRATYNKTQPHVNKPTWARGGLRIFVQTLFAIITVVSFILIVIMSIKPPAQPLPRPPEPARCALVNCLVTCHGAPYYGYYEEDIVQTIAQSDANCRRVSLELYSPLFINATLPSYWLTRVLSNVNQISIIKGNLQHIPYSAFITNFAVNIHILILEGLQIKTWNADSLAGLTNLRTLHVSKSKLEDVSENALRAVDDTLETLVVTESGQWDPVIFTGAEGLERIAIVDFSHNEFYDILGSDSFVGLKKCLVLYLNSCKIEKISAGAFDNLVSIKVIYLNDNFLKAVPPGFFQSIIAIETPRPRLNLKDNLWLCDCDKEELRQLVRKDLLLVDVYCVAPKIYHGKSFTELEDYCSNAKLNKTSSATKSKKSQKSNSRSGTENYRSEHFYIDGSHCNAENTERMDKSQARVLSPYKGSECSAIRMNKFNQYLTKMSDETRFYNWSRLFKFSFFLQTESYTLVQISDSGAASNGLVWFQTSCPNDVYCIDAMPQVLRVYNVDVNSEYTFCPILDSGDVESDNCVGYGLRQLEKIQEFHRVGISILAYVITVFICLCFGAAIVYGLIRIKPTLLKGSKRILFVKHKTVDALVLPPKIPLRTDLLDDKSHSDRDKDIFTVSNCNDKLSIPKNSFKSVRSDKSSAPSYISALQPTEDQLAEWRIKHHFNNDLTITSVKSELSALSWVCNTSYYSLDGDDRTYESLN